MPSRHHPRGRGHHSYAPIAAEAEDTSVIYAQVDKGKKRRRGRDLNIFNTSSSSSSVRDAADCDAISGTVHELLHLNTDTFQSFMNLDYSGRCKENQSNETKTTHCESSNNSYIACIERYFKLSFLWIVWWRTSRTPLSGDSPGDERGRALLRHLRGVQGQQSEHDQVRWPGESSLEHRNMRTWSRKIFPVSTKICRKNSNHPKLLFWMNSTWYNKIICISVLDISSIKYLTKFL